MAKHENHRDRPVSGGHIVTAHFKAVWPEYEARQIVLELIGVAAERSAVPVNMIIGGDRRTDHVQARQWVMYEASWKGCTLPQIGRVFGLDHTTVLNGIRRETDRRDRVAALKAIPMFRSVRV